MTISIGFTMSSAKTIWESKSSESNISKYADSMISKEVSTF